MAGLADAFRGTMLRSVSSGGDWTDNLPRPRNDSAGRIYHPDIILQEQEMLRGGRLMQSEDGQQYLMPPQGLAPWSAWLNWMRGR